MTTAPALDTQARVILALALREVHTLYGGKSLGYLWAIIQTAFGVAVFWAIRHFAHAAAPHGMTVLTYLVAGFGVWNIITQTLSKCMAAIDGNRALLTFPQVTPLDIMLARCLVVTATQVISMAIILGCGIVFGYTVAISSVGMLIICVLLAGIAGRLSTSSAAGRPHDHAYPLLCFGDFLLCQRVLSQGRRLFDAQSHHAAH